MKEHDERKRNCNIYRQNHLRTNKIIIQNQQRNITANTQILVCRPTPRVP